jgi:cytidylate kinase
VIRPETASTVEGFVIAIDGPSGTGKSTVARAVAGRLGAGYLDTGAMYRLVTLAVLRADLDPTDDVAVTELLPSITFDTPVDPSPQRHTLAGDDVTSEIRSPEVTLAVTPVSANPAVRAWLLDRQRRVAHAGRMVVEGRDIGTVIAPDAVLKIFLTADASVRAGRRHAQNRSGTTTLDEREVAAVAADLDRRDSHDSARAYAPLALAADAVVVDSTGQDVEQTVERILALAAERGIR